MKIWGKCVVGAMCLSMFSVSTVTANLIANGSFETGVYNDQSHPGFTRLPAGSLAIDGWVVGGDGIDWHVIEGDNAHFGRNGIDGSLYAVDLSLDGPTNGMISQTFATTAGSDYELSFLLGSPWFNSALNVSIMNQDNELLEKIAITSTANPQQYGFAWEKLNFEFRADSPATTLSFEGGSIFTGFWAPVIDNVSVNLKSVPEPSLCMFIGMGLFGLVGLGIKRRK